MRFIKRTRLIALLVVSAAVVLSARNATTRPTLNATDNITPDDIVAFSGAYVWKFKISFDEYPKHVSLHLLLRDQDGEHDLLGKDVSTLVSADETHSSHEIVVAVMPSNGDIFTAEKLRVAVLAFGQIASNTRPNPFAKLVTIRSPSTELSSSSTIDLLGGFTKLQTKAYSFSDANVSILLKFGATD